MSVLSDRLPVFWCQAPDPEEDEDYHSMTFRVVDDWFAVNDEQLILPIKLLARDGTDLDEPQKGLLKQYGGESMLNDVLVELLQDGDEIDETTRWEIVHSEDRRTIHRLDDSS